MATKSYLVYSKDPSVSPAETLTNFRGFLQSKGEEIPIFPTSCYNEWSVQIYHLKSGITAVLESPSMAIERVTFSGKIKDIERIVSETRRISTLEERK